MMPTEIEYREKLTPPYQSSRNVQVYGDDKERRLQKLPQEIRAFESAVSSVVRDIRQGNFARR